MRFSWPSYRRIIPGIFSPGNHLITFIEHEIPLLFLTVSDSSLHLNYSIDEDEETDTIRYLHVPITKMQSRALATAGLSLYYCLEAENIHIYDVNLDGEISLTAELDFSEIPSDALPPKDEKIPPLSEKAIKDFLGFDTGDLCFLLENEETQNNTLSFDKLSKFLNVTQKLASESTSYFCEKSNTSAVTVDSELRVVASKAASFAIVTTTKNEIVKDAISELIPEITNLFLNNSPEQLFNYLDSLPQTLILSFFNYCKQILNNKYESIITHKKGSLYLNHSDVDTLKNNVNNANYSRTEDFEAIGYLVGANLKTNYFYFEDIERNLFYKGYMSTEFAATHTSLTLSESMITWKAKFNVKTEFKFSNFKHSYELVSLDEYKDQS